MKWIVVAVGIAIFVFVLVRRRLSEIPLKFETIDAKMSWLANQAADMAGKEDVELDFSIESISDVEELLSELHDQYQNRSDQAGMNGLALAYGAYIGETIRRSENDAYWAEDHEVAGPESFPIHWQGGASFPVAWCYKRMSNGPEDNVWHKYQILKQQREIDSQ